MYIETALSTAPDLELALADCTSGLKPEFAGTRPDLLLVFATPQLGDLGRIPGALRASFGDVPVVGCSAGGLLGSGREIERGPALVVAGLVADGVGLVVRHLEAPDLPNPDAEPAAWRALLANTADPRGLMVLADPFSFPIDRLLEGLDYAYPEVPKFGGLASGGQAIGQHCLFGNDREHRSGAVVVALSGAISIETVVAQGCRPLGAVGTVTRTRANYVLEIDDLPALQFLRAQIASLDEVEQRIAERSPLFLGIEMDPFQLEEPDSGEFLIRNLVGFDEGSGAVAVGAQPAVGRRVRFHLRDRDSSRDDLVQHLRAASDDPPAEAGLMFACLGRGEGLYGEPGHDSARFRERFPDVPLAGFFCNGEIGPVGGTTHVHGYTSVLAILRGRTAEGEA